MCGLLHDFGKRYNRRWEHDYSLARRFIYKMTGKWSELYIFWWIYCGRVRFNGWVMGGDVATDEVLI